MTSELWQWATMGLLTLISAIVVTRPWWQAQRLNIQARRAANVATYRSRIDELALEREAGLSSPAESESLEQELAARLLTDANEEPISTPSRAPRRSGLAIIVTTVALIVFAGVWYGLAGSWREQRAILAGSEPETPVDPQVAAMIQQLAQRLQTEPENLDGWAMLGRSYFATQRYPEAAHAYAEANQRLEAGGKAPNAEWLVGQGEAIAFADGRQIPPAAAALFERALMLSPDYDKALWYGGLAAAQAGRLPVARARWAALLKRPDLPESMQTALRERLQTIDGETAASESATAPAGPATSPVSLQIKVSISPALAQAAASDATLFVFAKAASGPPMPLAVQRLPGATLPQSLTLDDSMAMAPQLRLSQFDRYIVTARLSKSGGAQPQSGDLQGSVEVDRAAAAKPVELKIDTVVP